MDTETMLTMDAGLELNIAIAKLAGWKVVGKKLHTPPDANGCTTIRVDYAHTAATDDEIFLHAALDEMIPNYTRNLNAAWELPIEAGTNIELWRTALETAHLARVCISVSSRISEAQPEYADAKTAALAVCRAWLVFTQWKQRKQEGGGT